MNDRRPKTLTNAFKNRNSHDIRRQDDSVDVHLLQEQLETLIGEKMVLEAKLKSSLKKNKLLLDKIADILTEKQDLEETLRRKNDLLKFKPRGKLASFMVGLQDKLINRPSLETVKEKKIWKNEPCFDTDLDKVFMHETLIMVPKVLVECVQKLESNPTYMRSLGLYRASGNHATIQHLRFKIDAKNYNILQQQTDPNNVTGIIKLFFRELKSPLLPLKYIASVIQDEKEFLEKDIKLQIIDVYKIYLSLPAINQSTIKFFMEHIFRVAGVPENEMNVRSLSIVCGACVCYETMQRQCGGTPESFTVPNKCVEIMIAYCKEVFTN